MPAGAGLSFYLDRESSVFDIYVDYYIPGYDDPETGESFYETNWTLSFYDNISGNSGVGGSGTGWDSGQAYTGVGFPSGEEVADIDIEFSASNWFSGVSASASWHLLNAGLALQDKVLVGGSGIDLIISGAGSDVLRGGGDNDFLIAGAGNDLLDGGDGNDTLDGNEGDDTMAGGDGDDLYYVDSEGDIIAEGAFKGYDLVFSTVSYALNDYVEDLSLIGPGDLDVVGNWGDNALSGNDGRNLIEGLEGDDELSGNGGRDTIYGDDGDDIINGGTGRDYMEGGWGDDLYIVDNMGDVVFEYADEGYDAVAVANLAAYTLGDDIESLINGGRLARFDGTGNAADNAMLGWERIDVLRGLSGDDLLAGMQGNDLLLGGLGADLLDGGEGIDAASYQEAASGVRVSLTTGLGSRGEANGDLLNSIEVLIGSDHADVLLGNAEDNRLIGGAGDDRLLGGAGRDWLQGGAGADEINGGTGDDGVSYAGSFLAVTVDLAAATATGGDATGDLLFSISHAEGGEGDDTLIGSAARNLLIGGGGADSLDGAGGNDTLRGGAGSDTLIGGDGMDLIEYAGSALAVTIDMGANSASGGDAAGDSYSGIEGVIGSRHDDTLTGDSSANRLFGGAGVDMINGGDGNDIIGGGLGDDALEGGLGTDTISFAGTDQWVSIYLDTGLAITGDGQRDSISGFENLRGSEVGDALYGNDSVNRITGGGGGDYIDGRGGNDILIGGEGDDAFYITLGSGIDRIVGFLPDGAGEDAIVMDIGGAFFTTFEGVMAVARQEGNNTVFDFGDGLGLILQDVQMTSLVASDFVFA